MTFQIEESVAIGLLMDSYLLLGFIQERSFYEISKAASSSKSKNVKIQYGAWHSALKSSTQVTMYSPLDPGMNNFP